MYRIHYNNYQIELVDTQFNLRFDLHKKDPKTGIPKFKYYGYGMTFDKVLLKIVFEESLKGYKTIQLEDYLANFIDHAIKVLTPDDILEKLIEIKVKQAIRELSPKTSFNPDVNHCPVCKGELIDWLCKDCNITWLFDKNKKTVYGTTKHGRQITITSNEE